MLSDDIRDLVTEAQIKSETSSWNVKDHLKGLSMTETLSVQPKYSYAVALINPDGGLNIGSVIRSAVMFGAEKVYVIGKRRFDIRSCVGSQNYIEIERIQSSFTDEENDALLDKFKKDTYTPVACETGGTNNISKIYETFPVFVFGSEAEGIPENLLKKIKTIYTIHTPGVMRSLNLSVAAGIVMHEFVSQWDKQ